MAPLGAQVETICIDDIAHALALKCRWTGHCRTFYSVADHSLRVARVLKDQGASPLTQIEGLLHDCGEAYLPDVAAPIKACILAHGQPGLAALAVPHERRVVVEPCVDASRGFADHVPPTGDLDVFYGLSTFAGAERRLLTVILAALGLSDVLTKADWRAVKFADLVLLSTEARDLMHGTGGWPWTPPDPLVEKIVPLGWSEAEDAFLALNAHLRREAGL